MIKEYLFILPLQRRKKYSIINAQYSMSNESDNPFIYSAPWVYQCLPIYFVSLALSLKIKLDLPLQQF